MSSKMRLSSSFCVWRHSLCLGLVRRLGSLSEIRKIFLLINQNLRFFFNPPYYAKFKHDLVVSFIKCLSKSKDNTYFSIHTPLVVTYIVWYKCVTTTALTNLLDKVQLYLRNCNYRLCSSQCLPICLSVTQH